ncbi:hypothetical protein E4T42_08427 [Aureobasidium subglaciale]|nr:hypothetical protein E4T42_08427 [Aureobasidium subglaciale]
MNDTTATDLQLSVLQGAPIAVTSNIPYLPNEVLYMITEHVDDEDLMNLRLSAKVFRDGAATRFATTFYEERAYELSPEGLTDLLEITMHPTFAHHIRTVIIGHGGKHSTAHYQDVIQRAFRNLAALGNTISIGLRRVKTSHNYQSKAHAGWCHMIRFLEEKMLPAAERTKLSLGTRLMAVCCCQIAPDGRFAQVQHFSTFNLGTSRKNQSRLRHLSLDVKNKIIRGSHVGSAEFLWYLPSVSIAGLCKLHLEGCSVRADYLISLFRAFGDRLECISLREFRIEIRYLRRETLNQLASLVTSMASREVLKSCKFDAVNASEWEEDDDEGSATIEANTPAEAAVALYNLANRST